MNKHRLKLADTLMKKSGNFITFPFNPENSYKIFTRYTGRLGWVVLGGEKIERLISNVAFNCQNDLTVRDARKKRHNPPDLFSGKTNKRDFGQQCFLHLFKINAEYVGCVKTSSYFWSRITDHELQIPTTLPKILQMNWIWQSERRMKIATWKKNNKLSDHVGHLATLK